MFSPTGMQVADSRPIFEFILQSLFSCTGGCYEVSLVGLPNRCECAHVSAVETMADRLKVNEENEDGSGFHLACPPRDTGTRGTAFRCWAGAIATGLNIGKL